MSEPTNLTLDSVIAHGEEQVFTVVDGETVLMSVENGKYYKLDDIGTRIWALIEAPVSVKVLCDRLMEEFKVDRATCEADVVTLLERMMKNRLIRVAPDA